MTEPVLDAEAVLAFMKGEPGHEAVAKVSEGWGAPICAVILSEVLEKLVQGGRPPALAEEALRALGLEVCPFDETLALECAWLPKPIRGVGLSLGDRACLALSMLL